MIVLGEKKDDANILHIIIGPETDFQFSLNGQSIMDVTEYVRKMSDPNEKCFIVLNKCESEGELIQYLNMQQGKMQAMQMIEEMQKKFGGEGGPSIPGLLPTGVDLPEQNNKTTNKTTKDFGIKCPKCMKENAAVIKDGMVYPCEVCQAIEDGLNSGEVPKESIKTELDEIERIDEINPDQKKSLSKYTQKNKVTKRPKKKTRKKEEDKEDGDICNV